MKLLFHDSSAIHPPKRVPFHFSIANLAEGWRKLSDRISYFFRLENPLAPDEVDAVRLEDRYLHSAGLWQAFDDGATSPEEPVLSKEECQALIQSYCELYYLHSTKRRVADFRAGKLVGAASRNEVSPLPEGI